MALLNSLKMSRVQLAVINRLLQIRLPKSTSFLHFHYGPSSTASLAQKAQEHNSKLKHRLFGVQQSAACCQGRNSFCSWIVIPSHPPSSLVPPSLNGLPQICPTFLATEKFQSTLKFGKRRNSRGQWQRWRSHQAGFGRWLRQWFGEFFSDC